MDISKLPASRRPHEILAQWDGIPQFHVGTLPNFMKAAEEGQRLHSVLTIAKLPNSVVTIREA